MEDDKFGKLVSKKEIATMLDVSERTVQRLVAKKQIMFLYRKKFHGGKIAYFPESEAARIKQAWENKQPLPVVEAPLVKEEPKAKSKTKEPESSETSDLTSKASTEDNKVKPLSKREISASEAAAKLILTVQEVSILTHIPEKELREDLRKGKLRGLFRGHGWKVKRTDLEDYVRSIYVPRRTDVIEDSGTNEIDLGDFGEFEPWEG